MPRPLKIDFVSDVSCPWCIIGLKGLEEALATEPKKPEESPREAKKPAPELEPEPEEDETAYLQRRAREERARASNSDDPAVRRIRFEMADEYLRRAEAAKVA